MCCASGFSAVNRARTFLTAGVATSFIIACPRPLPSENGHVSLRPFPIAETNLNFLAGMVWAQREPMVGFCMMD